MTVHKLNLVRNIYGSWKTDRVYLPFLAVNIPNIVNTFSKLVESPDYFLIMSLGKIFAFTAG